MFSQIYAMLVSDWRDDFFLAWISETSYSRIVFCILQAVCPISFGKSVMHLVVMLI